MIPPLSIEVLINSQTTHNVRWILRGGIKIKSDLGKTAQIAFVMIHKNVYI